LIKKTKTEEYSFDKKKDKHAGDKQEFYIFMGAITGIGDDEES
jgi:hypothetical protein